MFPFPEIDPIAFRIGPLAVRWYGLAYVTGIAIAWMLLHFRARRGRYDWTTTQVADVIFYAAIGMVLGGRFGYVLFYGFKEYLADPLAIFAVWKGGMSFHGGVLGFMIATWWYGRGTQKRFLAVTDFVVPTVPIGLLLGRIANFVNSELWGAPTDLPWATVFPDPRAGGIPRHPSQLYEAALEGLVLFIVLWSLSVRPRRTGLISGLFLLLYGCFRMLVEFVREPDDHIGYLAWDWLTMGQVLSLPMMLLGLGILVFCRERKTSAVERG